MLNKNVCIIHSNSRNETESHIHCSNTTGEWTTEKVLWPDGCTTSNLVANWVYQGPNHITLSENKNISGLWFYFSNKFQTIIIFKEVVQIGSIAIYTHTKKQKDFGGEQWHELGSEVHYGSDKIVAALRVRPVSCLAQQWWYLFHNGALNPTCIAS